MNSRLEFAMAVVCAVLALVFSAAAQGIMQQAILTGTCASIGYSTVCCPPWAQCRATDGNCHCGANCRFNGDCCPDAQCPQDPRTCRDFGILSCCDEAIVGSGFCDIYLSATEYCSCNVTCHERNDCCSDAESIGCVPQTCAQAGLGPGCCSWNSPSSSCFVGGGNCYCDSYCVVFNDCCEDVRVPQCPAIDENGRRSGVQSSWEPKNNVLSYAQPYKNRYINSYTQNVYSDRYAHQREAMVARAQRIKTASHPTAREYRARVRTAVRRPLA